MKKSHYKNRSGAILLTTTLFLGDISVLCNEKHVFELLSQYGELERVELKKSDRDPHRAHLGFGFVKFTSRGSAERALEELNGYFFMGRALRVGWADDYNRIGSEVKARDPKKNRETAQLYVSFSCDDSLSMVSEMDLGLVFGVFGNVVDIAIKKNVLNKESGIQSGYAFVHFALTLRGVESALEAAERVNNRMIRHITYKCKTDQKLLMQYLSLNPCDINASESHLKASIPNPVPAATIPHERRGYGFKSPGETFSQIHWGCERLCESVIPSISSLAHTLQFSTYGSIEEERVYSSTIFVRRHENIDQSVMSNEPSSVTRSERE